SRSLPATRGPPRSAWPPRAAKWPSILGLGADESHLPPGTRSRGRDPCRSGALEPPGGLPEGPPADQPPEARQGPAVDLGGHSGRQRVFAAVHRAARNAEGSGSGVAKGVRGSALRPRAGVRRQAQEYPSPVMQRFILGRVVQSIVSMFVVSVVVFAL